MVAVQSLNRAKNTLFIICAFLLGVLAKGSGAIDDIRAHWDEMVYLSHQHLMLLAISGGLAIFGGVVIGICLSRLDTGRVAKMISHALIGAVTVPALALLALAVVLFGNGTRSAIFTLWLVSVLPIVYTTRQALRAVPVYLREAALGMGMRPGQILWRVELPSAASSIATGIRGAMIINTATIPLVFLIGGGGLGELIFTGIAHLDRGMLLTGGIAAAALAFSVDFILGQLIYWLVPRGVNPLREQAGRVN